MEKTIRFFLNNFDDVNLQLNKGLEGGGNKTFPKAKIDVPICYKNKAQNALGVSFRFFLFLFTFCISLELLKLT